MTHRLLALIFAVLALSLACPAEWFHGPAMASDTTAAAGETQDIVHMRDGRVLHGKILSETRSLVVFEYFDPGLQIKTKLTLLKDNIIQIERNVPVEAEAKPEPSRSATAPAPTATGRRAPETPRTYGTSRVQSAEAEVTSIYVVPMRGQVGTDVRFEVYQEVARDIKAHKPDLIVFQMECRDIEDTFKAKLGDLKIEEIGLLDFENMHEVVNIFRNDPDIRSIPKVVWVHDAVGMSSILAMSWPDLYMTPTARLGGMIMVLAQSGATQFQDSNVRAKMYAAWTGGARAFLDYGGYSHELGMAMIDPRLYLSATWHGREVRWSNDLNGEYIVDATDKRPANFNAKYAEDFCISKGTAESMDDLALLLGYREYRLVDGQGTKIVDDYITNWRRTYDNAQKDIEDYQQFLRWATGEDTVKYLGRAKSCLERVMAAMRRYKAVEIRMGMEYGLSQGDLTILIGQINERLRGVRQGRGGAGGGTIGGRGGSGGRGPGQVE